MRTLFERNYFQDELPFDQEDFIGELTKIIITDWEYDAPFDRQIIVPGPPVTKGPSVLEMRYKVNIAGYGETYLYVKYPIGNSEFIFDEEAFRIEPFVQSKEDLKTRPDRGTVYFKHDVEGVEIPPQLVIDASNRVRRGKNR